MPSSFDRRTFVKMVGAAGAGAALADPAGAAPDVSTRVVDEQFDLDGGLQEALVVFDDAESASRLDALDLAEPYHVFEELGIAWTFLQPDQIETVAGWDEVRRVKRAEELEWHNDEVSRESMAVTAVHENLEYLGEDAHVVLIDSGLNASHPGIGSDRVDGNYHYVDEPTGPRDPIWIDAGAGDTDTLGHGQHCTGIAAGNGEGGAQGTYEGMAPEATITSYGTVQGVYLPYVVAAWDHMLGRIRTESEFNPDVVSNSYGVARDDRYNPNDPVNVASWKVFEEGVLPLFSYGNDGPGEGTGNRFAKAPHVLGVGAAEKTIDEEDNRNNRPITDFSSRGRSNVDEVYYDREQMLENLRAFHAIQDGATYTVDTGTFTGSVGPAVNSDPATGTVGLEPVDEDTGSAYEHLDTYENVDQVDLTLSLQPEGQWVRMRVYERQDDRWIEVAQLGEEPLKQHDTLTFDVNGGLEYLIELEPEFAVAADYTVEYTQYAKPDGNLRQARPLTLYRPGLSAHGSSVLSTQDKYDALGPLGEFGDAEPFYGRLSGTSMACPAAAGVAMLVRQAYRENCGNELPPADVMRVMEHTAVAHNADYSVVNTGTGFVDAEAAVRIAEQLASGNLSIGDLDTGLDALVEAPEPYEPPTDLEATGSRQTDRSASMGDRTMRVDVTLESLNEAAETVELYDEIPPQWELLARFSDARRDGQTDDGRKRIQLVREDEEGNVDETVAASEVDGDKESVTFTYFVESPENPGETNQYSFGPAEAVVETWAIDADSQGSETSEFGGTSDVFVAGGNV
jgi:serine protease AprX